MKNTAFTIGLSLLIGAVVIALLGYNPIEAYSQLFRGAFVGKLNFGGTLERFVPLMLTALAFATSAKVSVFNVGVEGELYLGAIAAIDPSLYESAQLDGASRVQKMWYITIPGIKATIVILLIMSVANILNAGFDFQYLLGFGTNVEYSETIDVFAMKYGIDMGNYSLSTAAGMFKTVVSIILLLAANGISSKLGEEKLI